MFNIGNWIDEVMFRIGLWFQDIEYPEGATTQLTEPKILDDFNIGFLDIAKGLLVGYFALAVYSEVKSPTKKSYNTNRKYTNRKFGVRYKGGGVNYG